MGKEGNDLEARGDFPLSPRREGAGGEGLRWLAVHSPQTGSGSVSEGLWLTFNGLSRWPVLPTGPPHRVTVWRSFSLGFQNGGVG